MSEMIEWVAAALWAKDHCPGTFHAGNPNGQARFRELARAAIVAMREPTADMVAEGWEHTADPCWKENVAAAWRAMIDAALEGGK